MSAIKNISLYIPHIFPNFDKEYIANAFKNIGEISQIDLVAKQDRNGNNYNAAYVHFNKWFTNKKAIAFYDSVVDENKEARLCHDEPWYWIVLPNTAKKHTSGDRKARIDLGESKSISAPRPAKSLLPLLAFIPEKNCPDAPKKPTYADAIVKPIEKPLEPLIPMASIPEKSRPSSQIGIEIVDPIRLWPWEEVNQSLETTFDEVAAFEAEIEAEMDEIEDFLEAEDENLVRIDGRYVQQLEQENWAMSAEIAELRVALIKMDQMYQAEAAKVRAFTTSVDL